MLDIFRNKMNRASGNVARNGKANGRPATATDQVERAQRLFGGLALLDGQDPFTGERAVGLPLSLDIGNVEIRDTS